MVTIEEASENYGECNLICISQCEKFKTINEKGACYKRLERLAFMAGVEWAERWISPDKELPPIGKNITVLLKGKDEDGKEIFETHTFDKITNHKRLKGWFDFYGFTHWRPIEHK